MATVSQIFQVVFPWVFREDPSRGCRAVFADCRESTSTGMESLTLSEVHHFLLLESRVLVLDPDLATPQFASLEILNERYDDEVHLTDDDVFHTSLRY